MSFKLSKQLCMIFGAANLFLAALNHSTFNLIVGIIMVCWAVWLDYMGVGHARKD